MPSVDGVKKISREEQKKSREIVLEAIERYSPVLEKSADLVLDDNRGKSPEPNNPIVSNAKEITKLESKEVPVLESSEKEINKTDKDFETRVPKPEVKKISREDRARWLSDMDGILSQESEEKSGEVKVEAEKSDKKTEESEINIKTSNNPELEIVGNKIVKEKIKIGYTEKNNVKIIKPIKKISKENREKWLNDFGGMTTASTGSSPKVIVPDFLEDEKNRSKEEKRLKVREEIKTVKTLSAAAKDRLEKSVFSVFLKLFKRKEEFKTEPILKKEEVQVSAKTKLENDEKIKKEEEHEKFVEEKRFDNDLQKRKKKLKEEKRRKRAIKIFFKKLFFKKRGDLLNFWGYFYYIVIFSFVFILFFYSLFAFLLLKIHLDNKVFRGIAQVLPVPAIIISDKIIDYYSYVDLLKDYQTNQSGNDLDVNIYLVKKAIKTELAKKYGLDEKMNGEKLVSEFNKKIIYDSAINDIAISRIKKIKEIVDKNGNFISTGNKFADSFGQIIIKKEATNLFADFQTDLLALEKNEISRIEYALDGYYLFYCLDRSEDSSEIAYVFIKSKDFETFEEESLSRFVFWNFVN